MPTDEPLTQANAFQRGADTILAKNGWPDGLAGYVKHWREVGDSWDKIARNLSTFNIHITASGLHQRYRADQQQEGTDP